MSTAILKIVVARLSGIARFVAHHKRSKTIPVGKVISIARGRSGHLIANVREGVDTLAGVGVAVHIWPHNVES